MNPLTPHSFARRRFLEFLAASPYVAACGGVAAYLESAFAQGTPDLIGAPAEALSVFDFEEVAHRKVQPGHWAYMASGVDGDETLRANREGFRHVELRPRRLRDATKVDMRVELFGTVMKVRFLPALQAARRSFFPDGEIVGRAGGKSARDTPDPFDFNLDAR